MAAIWTMLCHAAALDLIWYDRFTSRGLQSVTLTSEISRRGAPYVFDSRDRTIDAPRAVGVSSILSAYLARLATLTSSVSDQPEVFTTGLFLNIPLISGKAQPVDLSSPNSAFPAVLQPRDSVGWSIRWRITWHMTLTHDADVAIWTDKHRNVVEWISWECVCACILGLSLFKNEALTHIVNTTYGWFIGELKWCNNSARTWIL